MRVTGWRVAFTVAALAVTATLLVPGAVVEEAKRAAFPADSDASPPLHVPHADKAVHFVLFAALALLARPAFPAVHPGVLFAALLGYGVLTEVLQGLVPERTPHAWDLLANAAGSALAFVRRGGRAGPRGKAR